MHYDEGCGCACVTSAGVPWTLSCKRVNCVLTIEMASSLYQKCFNLLQSMGDRVDPLMVSSGLVICLTVEQTVMALPAVRVIEITAEGKRRREKKAEGYV